jgi:hypothetical protein
MVALQFVSPVRVKGKGCEDHVVAVAGRGLVPTLCFLFGCFKGSEMASVSNVGGQAIINAIHVKDFSCVGVDALDYDDH